MVSTSWRDILQESRAEMCLPVSSCCYFLGLPDARRLVLTRRCPVNGIVVEVGITSEVMVTQGSMTMAL